MLCHYKLAASYIQWGLNECGPKDFETELLRNSNILPKYTLGYFACPSKGTLKDVELYNRVCARKSHKGFQIKHP